MSEQANRLLLLYLLLTVTSGVCYWIAGMAGFDAICHGMTTAASAGFSTQDLSIGSYSESQPFVELVAIVFMFLAGCNFLLLVRVLIRRGRSKSASLTSKIEFRVYAGITVAVIACITLSLWFWGGGEYRGEFVTCLRHSAFQTVSFLTTTGYSTANVNFWPKSAIYALVICMFIGGCTGSTAGGFKILRVVVCLKLVGYSLRQFVRPRTVETLKIGNDAIPNRIVSAILALMLMWIGTIAVGVLVLSLDPRLDMLSAITGSLAMMSCIGPAISGVTPAIDGMAAQLWEGQVDIGTLGGYGALYPGTKMFMSMQMILGRLEILAPLALLTPGFWRR